MNPSCLEKRNCDTTKGLMRIVERESDIQRAILSYCRAMGIFCRRRNVGALSAEYNGRKRFVRFAGEGQSDLWVILPLTGRHFECEVKRPGQKPTELQKDWLDECSRIGALAFWVTVVDEFIVNIEAHR